MREKSAGGQLTTKRSAWGTRSWMPFSIRWRDFPPSRLLSERNRSDLSTSTPTVWTYLSSQDGHSTTVSLSILKTSSSQCANAAEPSSAMGALFRHLEYPESTSLALTSMLCSLQSCSEHLLQPPCFSARSSHPCSPHGTRTGRGGATDPRGDTAAELSSFSSFSHVSFSPSLPLSLLSIPMTLLC